MLDTEGFSLKLLSIFIRPIGNDHFLPQFYAHTPM